MVRLRAPLLLVPLLAAAACSRRKSEAVPIRTAAVERQTVRVDVEATGVITPIAAVEVRSKASGQITALPVETGTQVKPGQLLARIDPRDPQSRFDQARAAVEAANAQVQVTRTQLERNRALLEQGIVTAPELEGARLAYAQAQSQQTGARTLMELARIALEDVTITAPVSGTVIARSVSLGSVISSSTNSPSGGTILMQLANLSAVYDSALVNESDVGKLRPGQRATVTVDAYPGRVFVGMVEKIEPRATVQQSVTFFPVLIRIENEDGALMPGMNSDVSVLVEERPNVVAVPVDAIRQPREAATAAAALGLDPEKVQESLRAQGGGRPPGGRPGRGTPGDDSARPSRAGRTLAGGDSAGRGRRNGDGGDTGAGSPRSLGRGRDGAQGERQGGQTARGGGGGVVAGGTGGRARRGGQRGLVFVKSGETFEPRVVQIGITNYDVTEIVSGVREGEEVALMSAAVLQQQRTQFQERIRSRSSLPGMGGGATGGARPAGGQGAPAGGGGSGGGGGGGGGGGRGGQ